MLSLAPAGAGSHQLTAGHGIGSVYLAGRLQQSLPVVRGYLREEAAVRNDRFEQLGRGAEPLEERGVRALVQPREVGFWHGAKLNSRCHAHKLAPDSGLPRACLAEIVVVG